MISYSAEKAVQLMNHTTQTEQAHQRATSSRNNGMMMVRGGDNRHTFISHNQNGDSSRNNDYSYALKALLHGVPHLKCRIKNHLDTCLHGDFNHSANATPLQLAGKQYQGIELNATAKRTPYSILRRVITADKGYFCESIKREFREQYAHARKEVFGTVRTRTENLTKLNIEMMTNDDIQNLIKPNIKGSPQIEATFENVSNDYQMKNTLTSSNYQGHNEDLSKISLAVKSSRHSLAIFVPKICLASQAIKRVSIKNLIQYSTLQGKTIISKIIYLSNPYDGLTLQNTIAFGRICRAVSSDSESKTHHPIFNSVVLTQKSLGGLYNA